MPIFESYDGAIIVQDTKSWVEDNKKDFQPPICNKCMFSDQLKVFFVGGPNSRRDYHLEEGEEIFFQIKGHMVLKVVEKGIHKDIRIGEGEIFLLPAYVEHSPQRFAESLGCVVERDRNQEEKDCVRYFVNDSNNSEILWERWFHLSDVVKDLPPVIRQFNESEANKNGKPTKDSFVVDAPYKPKELELTQPINLSNYIDQHLDEINKKPYQLFADQQTRAEIFLYGNGNHEIKTKNAEMVLLFQRGEGELIHNSSSTTIKPFYTTRIKPDTSFQLKIKDGICLVAQIFPKS